MDMNRDLIKSGIFCFGLLVAGWCEADIMGAALLNTLKKRPDRVRK
jgi:hypothetical protein